MCVPLHGIDIGDPAKPACLFLHGLLGAHDDWQTIMTALSDQCHCLAVDLPGHGQTRSSRDDACYSFPGAAGAVLRYLDERGIERATVVGYSMGGRLALYMAVHHPDRCRLVVMESASPGLLDPALAPARRIQDEKWARRFEEEPLEVVLTDWYRQPIFASLHAQPEVLSSMMRRRLRNRPEEIARVARGLGVAVQEPLWEALPGLRCPVTAIVGEYDRKYIRIAEAMAARSDQVDMQVVPRAGHNAHSEAPHTFAECLRSLR